MKNRKEIVEKINKQKEFIAEELKSWATTFEDEKDENEDELIPTNTFEFITALAERLENNSCTDVDYIHIEFHIWQINQGGLKIIL